MLSLDSCCRKLGPASAKWFPTCSPQAVMVRPIITGLNIAFIQHITGVNRYTTSYDVRVHNPNFYSDQKQSHQNGRFLRHETGSNNSILRQITGLNMSKHSLANSRLNTGVLHQLITVLKLTAKKLHFLADKRAVLYAGKRVEMRPN